MPELAEEQHAIQFGTKQIDFTLSRAARKTMSIEVHPDRSVKVIAPKTAQLNKIQQKVKRKAPWILKQQAFFLSFHPLTPPRQYVNGETHLYLGKQYRLKIHVSDTNQVKLKAGYLHIYSHIPTKAVVKEQLETWYREKAQLHFHAVLEDVLPGFSAFPLPTFEIVIRKMEKRWGSCAASGRITLNLELIQAPKSCIEYVIVHELCHLIHPDHTRKFYALQEQMLPDWPKRKDRLERGLA